MQRFFVKAVFTLFFFCALMPATCLAQTNTPVLERNVSLQLSNTSIEIILNKISNQCSCKFSYSPKDIGSGKVVSVNVMNKSLREALNQIFANAVKYKVRGNYIILQKKSDAELKASKKNVVVKGYVSDANTGNKIPNATIYDKISLGSATSDNYGYYEIKLKNDKQLNLNINKENYKDTIIVVKQTPEELINIAIYPTKKDTGNVSKILSKVKKSTVDFFVGAKQKINSLNVHDSIDRLWQVSFVPYLGTNLSMSGNVQNKYSLNVIGGYSLGTKAVEVGGIINMDRQNVEKVQLAGVANLVGGNVKGLQMAGFTNIVNDGFKGLQCAGFLNLNRDSSLGLQLAGFLNVNKNKYRGMQAAGFCNTINGNMKGLQLAGFINAAKGQIIGLQASGFINYARKVKGCQLGIINISDSCKGLPIGIFSYVKSGYHKLEIGTDNQNYNVAYRTGTRKFYTIFTAAVEHKTIQGKSEIWTVGYGAGTAFQLASKVQLNLDLIANQYIQSSALLSNQNLGKLQLTFDYQMLKKISLFVGPVLNVAVLDYSDSKSYSAVNANLPHSFYTEKFNNKIQISSWIGLQAGLRFW